MCQVDGFPYLTKQDAPRLRAPLQNVCEELREYRHKASISSHRTETNRSMAVATNGLAKSYGDLLVMIGNLRTC